MDTVVERQLELPEPGLAINLFGTNDKNIKLIENRLDVKITARNDGLNIAGFESRADMAVDIIRKLMHISESGDIITEQNVRYLLELTEEERINNESLPLDQICVTYRGKPIKSKTFGQKKYVEAMRKSPIVFGIGPAGTGKHFWRWLLLLRHSGKNDQPDHINQPAVEAGERLGFCLAIFRTRSILFTTLVMLFIRSWVLKPTTAIWKRCN